MKKRKWLLLLLSNDGGGGVMVQEWGRGGYGTRMSVKSNDGGGGGNSARPAVMLQISLLSCVFLGIVWRFRILWEGSFSL